MGMTLEQVVPWGRSYAEYLALFALGPEELRGRILGCGDGPAAFNAELTRRGGAIVSVDPLYRFSAAEIRRRITETSQTVLDQVRAHEGDYVWRSIVSVEHLGAVRLLAMERFLADFEDGRRAGRYLAAALPALPFADQQFDLALSSHFLFLYSGQRSAAFHVAAIEEMLRVAHEVRVFPLLTLDGARSPHVAAVRGRLRSKGFRSVIKPVPYEFQRGACEMLVIRPCGAPVPPRPASGERPQR
jgi:SAM-dependent methyltransferase